MNYIGSKHKLSDFIKTTVRAVAGEDLRDKVFCDIFAGTGIVGRGFKCDVKRVIANDCEYYSYVLNRNYIGNHLKIEDKEAYIEELNSLPLRDDGFVYQNYCRGGNGERQYFSDTNGQRIDTARQQIERWKDAGEIGDNLYYFLLASLLESADKVANTASVYGAYLKQLKSSAQKELVLEPAEFAINANEHEVFNSDSRELIKHIQGDILYLDPPYNARQYGANYHLLNTIAEYKPFEPQGKTGLRQYDKSAWCSSGKVLNEFENLVCNAQFKYIFLSYNNEGLMSVDDIRRVMQKYGRYDLAETDYQRFKADKDANRNHKATSTKEYLHILEKS
jgi:adenine-specific DNA-methyltransferase